jgi:hypothetical protein
MNQFSRGSRLEGKRKRESEEQVEKEDLELVKETEHRNRFQGARLHT